MHEFGLVLRIVDIATKEALNRQAERVTAITIALGEVSGVVRNSLEFAIPVAFKDTILENAEVKIEEIKAVAKCTNCKTEFSVPDLNLSCPDCGKTNARLLSGDEFLIKDFCIV